MLGSLYPNCNVMNLNGFNILWISSLGSFKDQRVHSAEDLLLQETDDKLPDSTEHLVKVQVRTSLKDDT